MFKLNEFNRNVAKVMSGTFIAQVLPFALAAIFARIYSVEDYGDYYSFAAIVSILGSISSGKYEMAILNPKEQEEAIALCQGSIFISLTVNSFILLSLLIAGGPILELVGMESLSPYIWMAPICAFMLSSGLSLSYLLNREKAFGDLTRGKIILSTMTNFSRLGMGLMHLGSPGLILSLLIGYLSQGLFFLKKIKWSQSALLKDPTRRKKLFRNYADFPKSMIPATLLNKSSNDLPPLLMKSLYSSNTAGIYGQMAGLIRKPLSILGKAFEEVYKQKAGEQIHEYGHCRPIFYATLKKLFLIGIIPFGLLFLFAPDFFRIFLGEKWIDSGYYARYFAIPLFLQFIISPLSSSYYLLSHTRTLSRLEFLQLSLILLAFVIAAFVGEDAKFLILCLSISYSIAYLCKIIFLNRILNRIK